MSDTDSSPDQLDQLFAVPGTAPTVPTAKIPTELQSTPGGEAALPTPEEARLRTLQRFSNLVHKLTPVAWVTPLLLLSNVIVYVTMVAQGVDPIHPSTIDLRKWGANYSPLTWGGEPWRLISSVFVHCGLLHLVFNMWALLNIGRFLEKLIGNVGLLVVYFASGILGSMASLWWNGDVVSAGASGAIFGLMGALASFLWNRSDSIPLDLLTSLRGSVATFIFYNLLFGAAIEGIDQAAHIGGLLGGLVCGLLLSQPLDESTKQRRITKNLLASTVCGLGIGILIFQHPAPPPDLFLETQEYQSIVPPSIKAFSERAEKFDQDQLARQAAVKSMQQKLSKGEITDQELAAFLKENAEKSRLARLSLATWIEQELLPPWRKLCEEFKSFTNVPTRRREQLNLLRANLIQREESWELAILALRRNDPLKWTEFREKQTQAELIEQKLFSGK